MRKYVIFVGVGGVGKTTVVYRLVGVRAAPSPTKRPGIYHVNLKGSFYHILDVPGQYVEEVVEALSKMIFMFFDRDLFVHDLTRQDTLQALYDIADGSAASRDVYQLERSG